MSDARFRLPDESLIDRERDFMATAIDSLPGIFYVIDKEGHFLRWNANLERVSGYTAEEVAAMHPLDFFEGTDKVLIAERIQAVFETGEATAEAEFGSKDGNKTPYSFTGRLTRFQDVPCLVGMGIDISERNSFYQKEIAAQKRAAEKEQFLAETSHVLASSLDYEITLATVAKLAVPHLADWCSVYVFDAKQGVRRLALAHVDPEKARWAEELRTRYPVDPKAQHGIANVLRTGRSELFPEITEEMLAAWDAAQVTYIRALGLTSMMIVAIVAQGRTLGVILFATTETGRLYTPADLAVAEDVAARAALAMENARLFNAEKERSEQLSVAISEIHHRVKNNLQSVAALLELQIPDVGNQVPVAAVYSSLSQIKTIALVHDLLARDRIGVVDMAQVFSNLAMLLSTSMGTDTRRLPIHVEAHSVEMATKTATALALAVNELLTNAAKHSDIEEESAIRLWLQRDDQKVHVTVEDNGPGFPPDFDPSQQAGIGLSLVLTLIQHELRGRVRFRNIAEDTGVAEGRGARVEIVFPVSSLTE